MCRNEKKTHKVVVKWKLMAMKTLCTKSQKKNKLLKLQPTDYYKIIVISKILIYKLVCFVNV